ncbi:MAG: protein O-mannosyl-transferase family [bacterium]
MNKKLFYGGWSIILIAGFLYWKTLAPTYLWSDSAKLAICVHQKFFGFGWGIHGLHNLIGLLFSKLPFELAYTQNLMSAFFAVLGLLFIYFIVFKFTKNIFAALIAAFALGVSQTYWHYAVINESYAVDIFFRALCLWLIFQFREKMSFLLLFSLFFFWSLSLSNHNSHLLWLPGYLFLIWRNDNSRYWQPRYLLFYFFAIFLGFFPLFIAVRTFNNVSWMEVMRELVKTYSYLPSFPHLDWRRLPLELIRYPFYLAYQFPFLVFFAGIWGAYIHKKKDARIFYGFLILFLFALIPASGYYLKTRQFALLLPTYLIFSLWLGVGIDDFLRRLPVFRLKIFLILLIFVLPTIGLYAIMPGLCKLSGVKLGFVRVLPYRDNFVYYLWPPKNREYGARDYVKAAFEEAEPNSVIIADFNPGMAFLYAQKVMGERQDVLIKEEIVDHILYGEEKPIVVLKQVIGTYINERPVYLADTYEPYYFTSQLEKDYQIIPGRALARVVKK